jgi:hypothetical protein
MLLQQALLHIDIAIYRACDALLYDTSKIIHGQVRGAEDSARTEAEVRASRAEITALQAEVAAQSETVRALRALAIGQIPFVGQFQPELQEVVAQVSLALFYYSPILTIYIYLQASPHSPLFSSSLQQGPITNTAAAAKVAALNPGPPVYELCKARTVSEAWRKYKTGIGGGPAIEELEALWQARWRPLQRQRTA